MSNQSAPSAWHRLRSYVYDRAISNFTSQWYEAVLTRLPENSHILDIGIGTGAALIANASLLRAKNISVTGVDYDAAYVEKCRLLVAEANLSDIVTVIQADIHQFTPPDNKLFDFVYFGASFMLLPDQVAMLQKVVQLLADREDGRIYFTQTFELRKNAFMEWLKPNLQNLTTIDFGKVTYEADFEEVLRQANVSIEQSVLLDDGKRVDGVRESRLICGRSAMYSDTTKDQPN